MLKKNMISNYMKKHINFLVMIITKLFLLYRLGDYETAIKHFKKNKTLESQFNLANSLLMNEQIDEAISQYEKILTAKSK